MFPNVTPISVLVPNEDVKSRETPTHTLKNRANKCKTCWGKKEVSIRKSSRPIVIMRDSEGFPLYDRSGGLIYSANPEVVKCHCQH